MRPSPSYFLGAIVLLAAGGMARAESTLVSKLDPFVGNNYYADVWCEGDYAFIGSWDGDGVGIIDISDPTTPVLTSQYIPNPKHGSGKFSDVKVDGGIGYFANDAGGGLHIVDVSDPVNPTLITVVTSAHGGLDTVHNCFVDRGFLYEADSVTKQLRVLDVRDPGNPIGLWAMLVTSTTFHHDMTIINDRLYTSAWSGDTKIFDISDIENQPPVLLGAVDTGFGSHSNWATEDHILVSCREVEGGDLRLFDTNDPANPIHLATIDSDDYGLDAISPHNPIIVDDVLYVSWYQAGLVVFDVEDPTNPIMLTSYDTFPGGAGEPGSVFGFDGNWGVFPFMGNDAVVLSDMDHGLFIIDVSEDVDGDYIGAVAPGLTCINAATPTVTVPFEINRIRIADLAAYSVTFELSPELSLVSGAGDIAEGTYMSDAGNTLFFVTDLGGGSYTVDCAILGSPCGATAANGVVFTAEVAPTLANGAGTITVTDVVLRDCDNNNVLDDPGAPFTIDIDTQVPAAIDLSAAQVTTGNDGDGTTPISVNWVGLEAGASLQLYRKGFGAYPEYDDEGGTAPTAPTTVAQAIADGWTLVPAAPTDEPTTRDFWHYIGFAVDGCGNESLASPMTAGSLNYHLGDVSNGAVPGQGDNLVNTSDISALGSRYGDTLGPADPDNFLDVGPTQGGSVGGLPQTDGRIGFEDLILFAINFGVVNKEWTAPAPVAANAVSLRPLQPASPGETLEVAIEMAGDGRIQGLSLSLDWDRGALEWRGVRAGPLLDSQGGAVFVAPARPGVVDAAIMGVRDRGISGRETLVIVTFRVLAPRDPGLSLGDVTARDASNQPVDVRIGYRGSSPPLLPAATALHPNVPNPFNPLTTISFELPRAGDVRLEIFDVTGRRVDTLARGHFAAGRHDLRWVGTDASGRSVASGVYVYRLSSADGFVQSRRMTLLK